MNHKIKYDINCDLGEGDSLKDCENDTSLMPYITRCNIACGGHAGSELTIRETLINAKRHNLIIGAHPSYPDKENFGRHSQKITISKLKNSLKKQIDLLINIAAKESIEITHIKLHGALYNDVEQNFELALEVVSFFKNTYPSLEIIGLASGKLHECCKLKGLKFIAEGFVDRMYLTNGQLSPRSLKGSVISHVDKCINQAQYILKHAKVFTIDGQVIDINVQTLCLHGDNVNAIKIAKKLNRQLYIKE